MKKILGFLAFLTAFWTVFASSPIETKADTLFSLANQIISEAKDGDQMKETIKEMFVSCAKENSDFTNREACKIVVKKFWGELENQEEKKTDSMGGYSIKQYRLSGVVDGDTIKILDNNWEEISVRMIGIDAPESNTQRYGYAECYGEEASDHLKEILDGKQYVQIESDPTQWTYDKYGRLLWYVVLNWDNINKQMINDGYAFEYRYNLPYKYDSEFKRAEDDARTHSRGLWASSACQWLKGDKKEVADKIKNNNSSSSTTSSSSSYNSSSQSSYQSSDWRTYYTWPRWGCYYINSNGNKTYVDHSYCSSTATESSSYSSSSYSSSSYSDSHTWHTWPRWGNYYINSHGNRTYKKRR